MTIMEKIAFDLLEAKSMLAKLMATENIEVVHSATAETASFNVETRVLTLPIFEGSTEAIYDMFTGHEVGHALWTDVDFVPRLQIQAKDHNLNPGTLHKYFNITEDARIERKVKLKFPGIRKQFFDGYRHLIDLKIFVVPEKEKLVFIDRINIHAKLGRSFGIEFAEDEQPFVDRLELLETMNDALILARDIANFVREKNKNKKQQVPEPSGMNMPSCAPSGESKEQKQSPDAPEPGETPQKKKAKAGAPEPGEDEQSKDNSGPDVPGPSESGEDDQPDQTKGTPGGDNGSDLGDNEDDIPVPQTEDAYDKAMSSLRSPPSKTVSDRIYVKLPKFDFKKLIVTHEHLHTVLTDTYRQRAGMFKNSMPAAVDMLKEINLEVSAMVAEFERLRAADEYRRTSVSKTGRLDMNKLQAYKHSDDLFRKVQYVASGKNHGLMVALDLSGSMRKVFSYAIRQTLQMAVFCRRVNIPYEIYGFTNSGKVGSGGTAQIPEDGAIQTKHNFRLLQLLSSKMTTREFNQACHNLHIASQTYNLQSERPEWAQINAPAPVAILDMLTTPLNDCIYAFRYMVNDFRAKNNLQIVNTVFITDGASDRIENKYVRDKNGDLTSKAIHSMPDNDGEYRDYRTSWNYRLVYIDPITKRKFIYANANDTTTPGALQNLADQTGVNVVGYYIGQKLHTKGNAEDAFQNIGLSVKNTDFDNAFKSLKETGYASTTGAGYSMFYLVNADPGKQLSKLDIGADSPTKRIAEHLAKASGNRGISKIVLSKMVAKLAA
jgi:hypothetical protein